MADLRDEIACVLATLCTGEMKDSLAGDVADLAHGITGRPCKRDYARADAVLKVLEKRNG